MTVFKTARGRAARGDGGDGREESTGQLHTRLHWEMIEIRDFLEWGGGRLVGDHQFKGLAAAVLTLAAALFFACPVAGLVAAGDFGLDFLVPVFFLVVVTLGCEGASVTG